MTTAPTFIQAIDTLWTATGNAANQTIVRTTSSFSVQAGDVLIAYSMVEGLSATIPNAPTVSDSSGLTWSLLQQIKVTNYSQLRVWWASVSSSDTITVSFTETFGTGLDKAFGGSVFTFRNSTGIGSSAVTNVLSGAPTLNITTIKINSAIVVVNGDWNAADGASRVWRENASTFSETTYFRDSARYTVYGGYHANAGAIGTYAVGLSAPDLQKYSIAAVEVMGTDDIINYNIAWLTQ